jgi:mannitol/fructose-specific phosphotransferase system IIA component (Ntr-type)
MARSTDGLVYGSPEMGKTHVFFLLALRNDALHLRWLSRLAWIARNPGRLNQILEATSAEEIHATVLDAASNLPSSLKPTGKPTQR